MMQGQTKIKYQVTEKETADTQINALLLPVDGLPCSWLSCDL